MDVKTANQIFLTGATGFIGSHVAQYFSEKGVRIICAVRPSSDTSFLEQLPVQIIQADLCDEIALNEVLASVDFVIHTAGMVNDWSDYNEFYKSNVLGTFNLMNACANAGIKNVIVTGTNASYGEEDSMTIKDETSPSMPVYPYFLEKRMPNRLNHYRITKHMATLEAIRIARTNEINLTVMEPVWVYGEREFSSGFYEYMKTVKSGIPFFPGSRKNHFHVVYVGDLASAYYQAFSQKLHGINRFLIGNDQVDKMEDIYTIFCREMGIRKPVNLPKAMVYPVGLLMELVAELARTKNPPLLSRSRVNMFYDNICYGIDKAKEMLSFEQKTSLEEGIARTVAWYKNHKLI